MPLSFKPIALRFSLITFGVVVGCLIALVGAEILLRVIKPGAQGSEFESLADLQRSLFESGDDSKVEGKARTNTPLGHIVNPHPNDKIIYDLRQNLSVQFQNVPLRTNEFGMRGPATTRLKPHGTIRIALLGDSFAFGWGVLIEESFGAVLERNLNRFTQAGSRVELLNFGTPGYSTFQEVELFRDRVRDFDPDIVLVYFVENDFGFPFYVRDVNSAGRLLPSLSLAKLAERALGTPDEERYKMTIYDANRSLVELATMTSELGIPLFLTINPKKSASATRQQLWALRERREIQYLDLYPDLITAMERESIADEAMRLPTDPHPSALKHRILGDILTPHLLRSIGLH